MPLLNSEIQTSVTQWHRLCAPILCLQRQQWPKNFVVKQWRWFKCWGALWKHCQFFYPRPAAWCWTQLPRNSSHAGAHTGCTHTDIPLLKTAFVQMQTDLPEGTLFYRQAKMSVWGQKLFYVYQKNNHENPLGSYVRPVPDCAFLESVTRWNGTFRILPGTWLLVTSCQSWWWAGLG